MKTFGFYLLLLLWLILLVAAPQSWRSIHTGKAQGHL